ncbi:MAG: sulfurtransferase complex subunit TusB [Telmatospirillum sp.]|nr:sulfurtransferase complex subunit TusB [Telmatospirillum sp.]
MSDRPAPLHTVNKSPLAGPALQSCLAHLTDGAAVLLMEDGVYAALAGALCAGLLADALRDHPVYVLGPDLALRGLAGRALVPGVSIVDYEGFVTLATRHSLVQAWV